MKKINAIMNETETTVQLINKLDNILEPFALLAKGKNPIYMGLECSEVSIRTNGSESVFKLFINKQNLAKINLGKATASVFGSEDFSISQEDRKLIEVIFVNLKNSSEESEREFSNPIEEMLHRMGIDLNNIQ